MDQQEQYILRYSSPCSEALDWLERQTHLRTRHARMLSGPVVGALLRHFSMMIAPMHILEIGTFTGYSSICLAEGLRPGGRLDALEVNDELEDLIREAYRRSGMEERINLHIGDAKELIPTLDCSYDLVYIDANKREYVEYLDLVMEKVHPGSCIIADNVLWDGKVYDGHPLDDAQTHGIIEFNRAVVEDPRLENYILPLRDGLNVIRVVK